MKTTKKKLNNDKMPDCVKMNERIRQERSIFNILLKYSDKII